MNLESFHEIAEANSEQQTIKFVDDIKIDDINISIL